MVQRMRNQDVGFPLLKNGSRNLIIYYSKSKKGDFETAEEHGSLNRLTIPSYEDFDYLDEPKMDDIPSRMSLQTTTISFLEGLLGTTTASGLLGSVSVNTPSTHYSDNLWPQLMLTSKLLMNFHQLGRETPHSERHDEGLSLWLRETIEKMKPITQTMYIPITGILIFCLVLAMLAISYGVHFRFAHKRKIRQVMFSSRALWYKQPGRGEAMLNNCHYTYKQSDDMMKGSESPIPQQRNRLWSSIGTGKFNPKEFYFYRNRNSLWLPSDSVTLKKKEAIEPTLSFSETPKLRRCSSHFELVMPNDPLPKKELEKSSPQERRDSDASTQSEPVAPPPDHDILEEMTRSHLRNILTAFQWRTRNCRNPKDLNRLVDEYADRCFKEGRMNNPLFLSSSVQHPAETPILTSFQQKHVTFKAPLVSTASKPVSPTSSLHRYIPKSYSTASAISQFRANRRLLPLRQTPQVPQRSAVQGSHPSSSNENPVWGGLKAFFAPDSISQSFRSNPLYTGSSASRSNPLEAGDSSTRATGVTATKMMFGKPTTPDIFLA